MSEADATQGASDELATARAKRSSDEREQRINDENRDLLERCPVGSRWLDNKGTAREILTVEELPFPGRPVGATTERPVTMIHNVKYILKHWTRLQGPESGDEKPGDRTP